METKIGDALIAIRDTQTNSTDCDTLKKGDVGFIKGFDSDFTGVWFESTRSGVGTFPLKDFEKHTKKPTGYKLVAKTQNIANGIIEGLGYDPISLNDIIQINRGLYTTINTLNIIDNRKLFTPIYGDEVIKVMLSCDDGTFTVSVTPNRKIMFGDATITVDDLISIYASSQLASFNEWSVTFNKVTIGCKHNIPMSYIRRVIDVYNNEK